jgi:pimeloyl-ACP methyl ester carboxylesterase
VTPEAISDAAGNAKLQPPHCPTGAAQVAESAASGRIVAVKTPSSRKRGQSLGALDARYSPHFRGISGEFCRVRTTDALELNGFYCAAGSRERKVGNPICLVHVHGWDGNFYENRFIDYAAEVCARRGFGFVSGNNRGHDYIADILRNRRIQKSETRDQNSELGKRQREKLDYVQVGGMYEKLADSVADIKAWIDFAVARGAKRVVLQGHSHGAIKVVHYLTTTRDPRVCGLILLSPSDDMGWARKQLGQRFLWVLARARELVRAGNGRQLLPAKDFPYPVSAATFFDCYNKGSITGIFNLSRTDREEFPELVSIRVPVLLAVGTVEEAFVGAPRKYVDDVRACMVNCPSFTGAVIDGAPHNYLGHEPQLASVLDDWLKQHTRISVRRSHASDQFAVCSLQGGTRTDRRVRR